MAPFSLNGTVVTYTPNANYFGPDAFNVFAIAYTGGIQISEQATVSITVNPVNDAPTAIAQVVSTTEDVALEVTLLGTDPDPLDTLEFEVGTASNGTLVLDGSVVTYTPDPDFSGSDSFTFTVDDGTVSSLPAIVSITVGPVNDAPVAVDDGSLVTPFVTLDEDVESPVQLAVLNNDSDADEDPLTVSVADAVDGVVVINGDNTLSYTPPLNFNGPTTISYSISDGQGGTDDATVFLVVSPVNDVPVALAQNVSVNEDEPVNITLSGSDVDGDMDAESLIYTVTDGVSNGTLDVTGRDLVYTPGEDFNGTDSFMFKVSDGFLESEEVEVVITVDPVNDNPIAVDDGSVEIPFLTFAEDPETSVVIPVLDNDSDVDLDPIAVIAATSPDGTVDILPGGTAVSIAPNANFNGPTTISYTISDGQGGTDDATVYLDITPVNDAPVAVNDGSAEAPVVTIIEDSQALTQISVLANDSDVDLDPLTVQVATSPNGTVGIILSGTAVTFTPAANFSGIAMINYTVSDGQGGTANGTAFVAVTGVNDPPVAVNDGSVGSPLMMNEDAAAPFEIAVLANDSDVDLDTLTVTAASPTEGSVAIINDTSLSFTPPANFNGPLTIAYSVSDGQGGTAAATVFVMVTPVNDAPVALAQNLTINEDEPENITLSGSGSR